MNAPVLNGIPTRDAMQGSLGFVEKQTSHIEAGVYRHRYPELNYAQLVPVDTSANPFVTSVTYYSMDGAGKAEWMSGNAQDVPTVGFSMDQHETPVHTAGIGYDYGYVEVQQAQMLGVGLPGEKANLASRAYEQMVYDVALGGDASKGFQGLYNYSGVPQASAAATGAGSSTLWADKDGDQIMADVNQALIGMVTATKETELADTLVMPTERFMSLGSRRLGDTNMTILSFLRQNNVYTAQTGQPLQIFGKRNLLTKGVGNTARMLAYRRSPDVLKMHIPMPHRFFPVQIVGFQYKIPGMFRLGGLDWRLPKAGTYIDGI